MRGLRSAHTVIVSRLLATAAALVGAAALSLAPVSPASAITGGTEDTRNR